MPRASHVPGRGRRRPFLALAVVMTLVMVLFGTPSGSVASGRGPKNRPTATTTTTAPGPTSTTISPAVTTSTTLQPTTTTVPATTTTVSPTTTTTTAPTTTTTTAPTTTTTTAPPVAGDRPGFVTRRGSTLYLDGRPYRFTGVTAYQLATLWSVNWGCGAELRDIDGFLGSLRPGSMIKVNATQAQAFNNKTSFTIDWAPFDRMVSAAERHGQKLIMGLSAQQGDCDDGHWKDRAWYDGGYRQAFNDDGRNLARLPYLDWIQRVVARYKDSPAVGMWQLVGEPEASNCASGYAGSGCYNHLTCPSGGAASLRAFFDTVGAEVKRIDPHHLIGSGVIGGGQCGLVGAESEHVHASPYIDVATYHDYGADDVAVPAELQLRLDQARQLGKPLVVDEVGIYGGDMAGCLPTALRTAKMQAKMVGGFAAGVQGFTPWNWMEDNYGSCGHDITPVDSLLPLLHDFPL